MIDLLAKAFFDSIIFLKFSLEYLYLHCVRFWNYFFERN